MAKGAGKTKNETHPAFTNPKGEVQNYRGRSALANGKDKSAK